MISLDRNCVIVCYTYIYGSGIVAVSAFNYWWRCIMLCAFTTFDVTLFSDLVSR